MRRREILAVVRRMTERDRQDFARLPPCAVNRPRVAYCRTAGRHVPSW
jgi:hypothetical protein